MKIEKRFAIRLNDGSLSEMTFSYDFDTGMLTRECLPGDCNCNIQAIRIGSDSGISSWSYNIDCENIKRIMVREHNIKSCEVMKDLNDRRLEDA